MQKKLALYLHFPFCTKKCNYCNFYSIPYNADLVHKYCYGLRQEIINFPYKNDYKVITIYLGGGSPSLIPFHELVSTINLIREKFCLDKKVEFTLEANPIHVSESKAENWKITGVNRISMGAQSFNNEELSKLGRLHSSAEIGIAANKIKEICCNNISLDLMYGIPGQTMKSWLNSLQKAIKLSPKHISSYCLKLEKETFLAENKVKYNFPDEELERKMYYKMISELQKNDYEQYEISNFSKKSYYSRHNTHIWEGGEYVGLGAAAHSFYKMQRIKNKPDIKSYLNKVKETNSGIDKKRKISAQEFMVDKIMLRLRLNRGISLPKFHDEFGIDLLDKFDEQINKFLKNNYLTIEDERLKFTSKALFISNSILSEFI